LFFNELQKPEETSASESASGVKNGIKSDEKPRNHWLNAVTGENGIRNPFGVADTPLVTDSFVISDRKV
jgi:hypothetical protein